jgi:hypothetical protein
MNMSNDVEEARDGPAARAKSPVIGEIGPANADCATAKSSFEGARAASSQVISAFDGDEAPNGSVKSDYSTAITGEGG